MNEHPKSKSNRACCPILYNAPVGIHQELVKHANFLGITKTQFITESLRAAIGFYDRLQKTDNNPKK